MDPPSQIRTQKNLTVQDGAAHMPPLLASKESVGQPHGGHVVFGTGWHPDQKERAVVWKVP